MKRAYWLAGLGLAAAVGVLALAGGGEAQSTPPPPQAKDYLISPWKVMHVGMDILVHGKAMPTVHWQGKTYLPVPKWDTPYDIRVWNHGSKRVAAIVSVDGLSVITLKPASEKQPGYLVNPYSSIVIKGWRLSDEMVAAFSFVERDQSYASKMGHPNNVGVIGLVAFEEMSYVPGPLLEPKFSGAAPAESADAKAVGGTGTGIGKPIYSPTYEVPFVRSANKRTITIYYDTVAALRALGVPVDPPYSPYPNPFPGDPKLVPLPAKD